MVTWSIPQMVIGMVRIFFNLQIVTSSTHFNENKKYIVLEAYMVQEPNNEFEDKSVKNLGWGIGIVRLICSIGTGGYTPL